MFAAFGIWRVFVGWPWWAYVGAAVIAVAWFFYVTRDYKSH